MFSSYSVVRLKKLPVPRVHIVETPELLSFFFLLLNFVLCPRGSCSPRPSVQHLHCESGRRAKTKGKDTKNEKTPFRTEFELPSPYFVANFSPFFLEMSPHTPQNSLILFFFFLYLSTNFPTPASFFVKRRRKEKKKKRKKEKKKKEIENG